MTYNEIKQYIILNSVCTANELLSECDLTTEELTAIAENDISEHLKISKQCGITTFQQPLIWNEIISLCKQSITPERIELLVWLMAGGDFDVIDRDFLPDKWIYTTQKYTEILEWLDQRKKNNTKFSEILHRFSSEKINIGISDNQYMKISKMLCENGYAKSCTDQDTLCQNLCVIGGTISGTPYLKPIAPLVLFKTYVKYKNRIMNTWEFSPDMRKVLIRTEYKLSGENDKIFKRNLNYCQLYIDLKECCPNADNSLCDAGFIRLTNLAEWAYEYLDPCDELPVTTRKTAERVNGCFGSCYGEPSFWFSIPTEVEELGLKKQCPFLAEDAKKATSAASFADLTDFVQTPDHLCDRLLWSRFSERIKPQDMDTAQLLFIDAMIDRFDQLLIDEICAIFDEYTAG